MSILKYVLFTWADYEPQGGFDDARGIYKTVDEAKESVRYNQDNPYYERAQIGLIGRGKYKVVSRYGKWNNDEFRSWRDAE